MDDKMPPPNPALRERQALQFHYFAVIRPSMGIDAHHNNSPSKAALATAVESQVSCLEHNVMLESSALFKT